MLKNKMRARRAARPSRSAGGGGAGPVRTNIWMAFKRRSVLMPSRRHRSKPVFSDIIEQMKHNFQHSSQSDAADEDEGGSSSVGDSLVASSLLAESIAMPGPPAKDGGGRMHTHMMFNKKKEVSNKRGKRRPMTRLKDKQDKHDSSAQTAAGDIDPSEWTGNQRVLHYGPLAVRDRFFYYYPKGWDILYPASFGFFPYRTSKFRGSSPTVCLSAFGTFVLLAGICMCVFGYVLPGAERPFWLRWTQPSSLSPFDERHPHIPPVQIAGPIFTAIGALCLLVGCCCWWCSLHLFSERLRHSKAHHVHLPPRRTTHRHAMPSMTPAAGLFDNSPYQPSPPQYTVLSNAYTEPTLYNPDAEMKLYPPIGSSSSMMSLQRHNQPYIGSVYNTLGSSKPHLAQGQRAKRHQSLQPSKGGPPSHSSGSTSADRSGNSNEQPQQQVGEHSSTPHRHHKRRTSSASQQGNREPPSLGQVVGQKKPRGRRLYDEEMLIE